MKEICIDLSNCRALGDSLCVIPTIRKLSISYNKRINVLSNFPEIFENLKYVSQSIKYSEKEYEELSDSFELISTFKVDYKDGICNKHNVMDIRQLHSISLGFMLTNEELELEYQPKTKQLTKNLPSQYVVIHPVQNWSSRTWDIKNWELLVRLLEEKKIFVVAVGKDSSELGGSNVQKPVFNLQINYGLDLLNKTTLDETWHLISNSSCFVTMDSGLLHLAGTTDCEIIQLGSSINHKFRAPYRKGTQDYKYNYVGGSCSLNCASDMKYGVREWGSIQGIPSLVNCLENKKTFECHPDVVQVYHKLIEVINKNKI